MYHQLKLFAFTFIALSLFFSGCGGGGGGGDSSDSGSAALTADAGSDVRAYITQGDITLDGTGSSFPQDAAGQTFTWTTDSGDVLGNSPTPVFSTSELGIFPITLVVSDGINDSAPDIVTVTVADEILTRDFITVEGFREFFSVEGASDGGFYSLGTVDEAADSNDSDIFVQKILPGEASTGAILDIPNSDDFPSGLAELENGVVAVVGTVENASNPLHGDLAFAIVDLNEGSVLFSKTYPNPGNDIITGIRKSNGGLLVSGSSISSDEGVRKMRFLRFDYNLANGAADSVISWDILVDNPGIAGYGVDAIEDNGHLIVLGDITTATMQDDIYLARIDLSDPANPVAENHISANGMDLSLALEKIDSGYLVIGSSNSSGFGGYDILALRTDSQLQFSGDLSEHTIGGGQDDFSVYARKITVVADGFLIAGATQPENTDFDAVLLALDSDGRLKNTGVYAYENASGEIALFAGESGGAYQLAGISGELGDDDFTSPLEFEVRSPEFFAIDIDPENMMIQEIQ